MEPFFQTTHEVLRPTVAGRFYPGDPAELRREVKQYLSEANLQPSDRPVLAILVPHAGYVFSGPVAGYSFRYVENQQPDTVLFLAISHQGVEGGCVFTGKSFETPLGRISVDQEMAGALVQAGPPLYASHAPYLNEHSIEVNLPFMQTVFPQAQVASILMTRTDPQLCREVGRRVADSIRKYPNKSVLLCVSSDMSHYPNYDVANRVDRAMLRSLESLDPETVYRDLLRLGLEPEENLHCVLCGSAAMLAAVEAVRALGAREAKILDYRNSGDSLYGDHSRVVGYGAFAIFRPFPDEKTVECVASHSLKSAVNNLNDSERRTLLAIARKSIRAVLKQETYEPQSSRPDLDIERGVFVTLKKRGELRGCLGRFDAGGQPLYRLVAIMAAESATHDMRFSPIAEKEIPDLDIQISVLSPLELVTNTDEIEIGRHGLQIRAKNPLGFTRSGTLLPQVASEHRWNREEFLHATCVKAGLDPEAWRDPQTEIYKYGAEVFGDLDFGNPPFAGMEEPS